jgi:hypothetical protein
VAAAAAPPRGAEHGEEGGLDALPPEKHTSATTSA